MKFREKMPKFYILLPVHNRKEITRRFVESLVQQSFTDYQLVLIDDGSIDGTAEMVEGYIPMVTVLRGTGSWFWAGSLQQGLNWLKTKQVDSDSIILFINDDVSFAFDYLESAVKVMSNLKGVLMLSRHRSTESGEICETGVFADLKKLTFTISTSPDQINCLSTKGLFIHWTDVLKIGDFYPRILPHYLSDYEYTIRAHLKGFKCSTSSKLLIEPNFETTGYHEIGDKGLGIFLKKYFSKKSSSNPIYWTTFIFLTVKPRWIIPNFLRIWFGACRAIFNVLSPYLRLRKLD